MSIVKKICNLTKGLLIHVCNYMIFPLAIVFCVVARVFPKKIDIGMGPVPMINNVYWAQALRLKGYTVETFANATYIITDKFDYVYDSGFRKIYNYIPILFFVKIVFRYKCLYVYFNGGPLQTIHGLCFLEPIMYHLAGVKLVVMPYGSDCHILDKTPNKMLLNALCMDYPTMFQKMHIRIKKQVEVWSKNADIVIGAMDTIDYMFFWNRVRQCHFAIDLQEIAPQYFNDRKNNQIIKVFHAPNHTNCKGTESVIKAIKKLKIEGYEIELVIAQNKPNSEIIQLIQSCDIIVDQLIAGWHGMFALEAMACGKPTICYMRKDLVEFFEKVNCVEQNEIPLISANVLTIYEVLKELLGMTDKYYSIGIKSRKYVEKYHSFDAIGEFFDEINKALKLK